MRKSLLFPALALLLLLASCAYLPAASDAESFAFDEVAHVFQLTEPAIFDTYGEPDAERSASFQGLPGREFVYGENRFRVEATTGYLFYACLADTDIAAPRGVTVGMKLADLVSRFASTGDETLHTADDGSTYRLLYGEYLSGADYGVIFYEGKTPRLVEYSSEGCIFACGIEGGKVAYLEYFVE